MPQKIVVWQLRATGVVTVTLLVWELLAASRDDPWFGLIQTVSALAAGVVCVVPGAWYAWRATRERSGARFLLQGVVKFVLTIALMALGIVLLRPAPAGFFGTFVLLQAMYVLVPLKAQKHEQAPGAGS
jgi:hypothetical protein